ncbi:MAG TPA: hypothetical protein VHR17_06225, partial [Thermoanaerobaculia bacterium]|nr:hypothetical protein [Thermoanaerobaculia bacterium]
MWRRRRVGPDRASRARTSRKGDSDRIDRTPDGSTLRVDACPEQEPLGLCTEDLRVTFSVLPERDLAQARISMTFYEGDLRGRQCATATSETLDLTAGRRASKMVSR